MLDAISQHKFAQFAVNLALGFTLILALSSIVGWLADIPDLLRLTPSAVPMPFNSALCFLGIAMGAFLYLKGYRRAATAASGLVLMIAALTLAQYLLSINLGIDEAIVSQQVSHGSGHPGRMAPTSAACFLLSSISFILYVHYSSNRLVLNAISALMTIVLALGLVALIGYIAGIDTTYGFGAQTHMSLQAGLAFVSFSLVWLGLVMSYAWVTHTYTYQLPMLCGALLLIITLSVANGLNHQHISTDGIVELVFWFGLVVSFAFMVLIVFFQRLLIQARDISEHHSAKHIYQSEIEHSHLSLKLATDVAQLGTWRWNVKTGALAWDERMFEIYQTPDSVKKSGLFYEYWYETVHPEDRENAALSLQAAVAEQKPWRQEFRLLLPGGYIKYIKASAICVFDNTSHTQLVFGGNLDMTPEKELQISLEEKNRLAEQSSLTKSRFLANMSHEIRTPMNGILGIGELLTTTSLNVKQAEYLALMMSSAKKLLSLLNDILDISKIEAGELNLEMICVPIEEIIGDSLKAIAPDAHNKGLDYHYVQDENVPQWVFTDPVRLGQILTNLVSNAIKFTDEGEILISVNAENSSGGDRTISNITIEVSDSGIGIDPTQVDSMFKPFFQADESTTRKYGGTGLGLSIVQQLVTALNGHIKIESKEGEGTTVSFTIPMTVGTREEIQTVTSEEYNYYVDHASSALVSTNCLVIDSQDLNRQWLVDMLHSWQCNVSASATAEEGLAVLQSNLSKNRYFNVMIVDQNLQDMQPLECIAKIKQICAENQVDAPATIIIMASNKMTKEVDALGIEQYLLKPVKQSEVFNAMMHALGKKELEDKEISGIIKVKENKQLSILVAEDHPVNQFMIREILEKRGHLVTIVENGRLAVEALEKAEYDVIVMDVQMPIMDGLTATKIIREGKNQADICIVGLTAKALKEDKNICLGAGMNHYLSKPANPEELIYVVESVKSHQGSKKHIYKAKLAAKPVSSTAGIYHILDLERCRITTANDMQLLSKLLQLSIENIAPSIRQLEDLQKNQNWPELAKLIHKCKGMLANFCSESFVADIEDLLDKSESYTADSEVNPAHVIQPIIESIKTFSHEASNFLHGQH